MKVSKKTRQRRKSVKALDADARQRVFERDGYRCVRCGTDKGIQWAHIITRARTNLRWLLENALTLCGGCHMFWWHKHPLDAVTWFQQSYPERYAMLMELKDQVAKVNVRELAAQLEER